MQPDAVSQPVGRNFITTKLHNHNGSVSQHLDHVVENEGFHVSHSLNLEYCGFRLGKSQQDSQHVYNMFFDATGYDCAKRGYDFVKWLWRFARRMARKKWSKFAKNSEAPYVGLQQ